MYENLSFIIPFFETGTKDRAIILDWVYMRLKSLYKDSEIVLSVDNGKVFNKGKTINNGAKNATRDILVIIDADIFFDKDLIDKSIENLNDNDFLIPYYECRYLEVYGTSRILKCKHDIELEKCPPFSANIFETSSGGISIMHKSDFDYINGFDEDFLGWGCEDNAFMHKASSLLNFKRLNKVIYHLYHVPCLEDDNFRNNQIRCSKINKMDKEKLIKYYDIKPH